MSPVERTPMYLVGGSLGSGKTTLLLYLLGGGMGRVAVIVNEFGELGIDGQVLAGENIDLIELPGGCVCCSLAGEFEAAVEELIEKVGPELILVETTGVAEADALMLDVEEGLPRVRVEALIVLVDADLCRRFPQWGYSERAQIAAADILVLNKVDLVEQPGDVEQIRLRLRSCNDRAILVETVQARLDPVLIDAQRFSPRPERARQEAVDHTRAYHAFVWECPGEVVRERFTAAVEDLPGAVWRAKGFLRMEGAFWLFNYVAGRWQVERAAQGKEALVFIGAELERCEAAIREKLEACVASCGV